MNEGQTPLVLVFTTAYLPMIGGAEVALRELIKRSDKLRFCVLTARFSRMAPKREQSGNISIRRLGFGFKFDKWLLPIFGFFIGLRMLRQEKRAVMWGMMVSQGTLAALFLKYFFKCTPFIVTLQEGDSEAHLTRGRFWLIGFFWQRVMRRADALTAISAYLAERARTLGFSKEVAIIPNGVDENLVSLAFERSAHDPLRGELGIAADACVVFSASRLVEKNGLLDLVDAIAQLHAQVGKNAYLVIAGEGPEHQRLEARAKALGISEYVRFLGSIPNEDFVRYYRMSDVFARPSLSEGLGSAFLEAMGAGVPIVATYVGGIKDFLVDGETGVVVRARDREDIARGIRRVLEDNELRERIIEKARALVIEKYLWVDIAKKMEDVLLGARAK